MGPIGLKVIEVKGQIYVVFFVIEVKYQISVFRQSLVRFA